MFTGLIKEVGLIKAIVPQGGTLRIDLGAPLCAPGLAVGDSLAVNGICLTVTQRTGSTVRVEAAAETRRITTLPHWRVADRVHLEPALRAGDPLGGHLVLGHVDGQGKVMQVRQEHGSWYLTIGLPPELARYLLPKGSVAVDGVSLTVDSGPFRGRFTVNVIPHTLARTQLGNLRVGQAVNLEMDVLVKAARGHGQPEEGTGVLTRLTAGMTPGSGRVGAKDADAGDTASTTPAATAAPLTLPGLLASGFRRRHGRTR